MATASWVAGDTGFVALDVYDADGAPVDLTAATSITVNIRFDGVTYPTPAESLGSPINTLIFSMADILVELPAGTYAAQVLVDTTFYPSRRSPLTFQVHESTRA